MSAELIMFIGLCGTGAPGNIIDDCMPRILIVCEYPTLLGGERSMLATLPAVVASGFELHVAGPPHGPLAEVLADRRLSHVAWSTHDATGQRLPLDIVRSSLATLIESVLPDLVHANSLSTSRIAGPVATELGVPSIGHLRDIVKLAPQATTDINCNTVILAVSRATRDYHVAHGLDANKCVVAYNGIDLHQFAPRQATTYLHRALNLPDAARLVAVVGQLGLRKATDVALDAALQLAGILPDVHWLIVGERTSGKQESRDFEQRLHKIASHAPLLGRVHFLGSRNDVARLLNECVLLVHAARQEPLGRVLLEAAASGLPVVATDVGGTREIFPAQADGAVLVPPDDLLSLTNAILGLLEDEPRRRSLAIAARRRACAQFDIHRASDALVARYRQLTNRR
jgi:glycosyltransferase involved in cell wall biosynthesis